MRSQTVVIGAGQAGLSTAYFLRRLGLDAGNEFVVLDRGPAPGGAWQFRWEAMRLGSAHRVNNLPGMEELGLDFATADRQAPAKAIVGEYYGRYEEHYGLHVVRPASVVRVEPSPGGLATTLRLDALGEMRMLRSPVIVNATGTWGAPFVPFYPGMTGFLGRHVHTADYRSAEEFRDQSVVVVGGGTSAIGFILELESVARSISWATRRPVDYLDTQELSLEGGANAVARQDEAARMGRQLPSIVSTTGVARTRRIQAGIERGVLVEREMFTQIEPTGVRWPDGSFTEADAIIWATGFRPELRHLAPLKLRETSGGIVVGGGISWRDPRVFFAGYGPTASTIGANRAGRTVARQVVATLSKLGM